MQKIIKIQFWVLLLGTIFAWGNFGIGLVDWISNWGCSTDCAVGFLTVNPFLKPCFYGAIFFLVALILSVLILKKSKE